MKLKNLVDGLKILGRGTKHFFPIFFSEFWKKTHFLKLINQHFLFKIQSFLKLGEIVIELNENFVQIKKHRVWNKSVVAKRLSKN